MRIAGITRDSYVNGPGRRNVLHVQGCTIACSGCFNKNTWSTSGGIEMRPSDVADALIEGNPDGITISGGEPMEQWRSVEKVIQLCLKKSLALSVYLFTGWTKPELKKSGWLDVMSKPYYLNSSLVDVVITGPYTSNFPSDKPLRSSSNQKAVFLNLNCSEEDLVGLPVVEVHCKDGETTVSGFPSKVLLNELRRGER